MDNMTVSLVLGGGGARGLAHIGVIRWLQAHGYQIQSIAGASMGALVGGIYAAGELDVYSDWVRELQKTDVIRYLDVSFDGRGLFKGERIIAALKELIGEHLIEDLPITYTAVAADVEQEKEIWLNDGLLFDAIRASIAIPTVFTPYEYRGRRLLDGGLVNPLPIAPTFHDNTDLTIAVNLYARPVSTPSEPVAEPAPKPQRDDYRSRLKAFFDDLQSSRQQNDGFGIFDVILKSYDTMQNTVARMKLAAYSPDILVDIPRNVCNIHEFYRANELIDIGWHAAEKSLAETG